MVFISILYILSLVAPLAYGVLVAGLNFPAEEFPIYLGLALQFAVGVVIYFYVNAYEHDQKKRAWTLFGYTLFLLGLSVSYLAGKSNLLWISWECSTFGAFLLYSGTKFDEKSIRSIVALILASGVSCIAVAAWVFLPPGIPGIYFLVFGLLLKSAILGFHFWLPEAHGGGPAHSSATYSGLMVNLPLILFYLYVPPYWKQINLGYILIPLCGLGVFYGGVTSFIHKDVKKSLAYSTIENLNFLWLCLFLFLEWENSELPNLQLLSVGFKILFFLGIVHHSFSKSFQFLSFGLITKQSGSTNLDASKGVGRELGIPGVLLGLGTFSFALLPGGLGFTLEATLLHFLRVILDLPNQYSIFVIPSLVLIIIGLALGGFSHLRIYYTLVFSVPAKPQQNRLEESDRVQYSIAFVVLGFFLMLSPIFVTFLLFFFNIVVLEHLKDWFFFLFVLNVFFLGSYAVIFALNKRKITSRNLWDCGSTYRGSELSIPGSVISEPLHETFGNLIVNSEQESTIDSKIKVGVHRLFQFGNLIRGWVHEQEMSAYLAFSSIMLIITFTLVIFESIGKFQ